jgi:hypothetical protein
MTIKEFCSNHEKCKDCSFFPVCPYNDYFDIPLDKINDEDNDEITRAIVKTALLLVDRWGCNND